MKLSEMQKQVSELSPTLPGLKATAVKKIEQKLHSNYYSASRWHNFCLECGRTLPFPETSNHVECPVCGPLKKLENSTKERTVAYYFASVTTCQGFQVVRIFTSNKTMQRGAKSVYRHIEVIQHWISASGQSVMLSRQVNTPSIYFDAWRYSSPLAVRNINSSRAVMRHNIEPVIIIPGCKVLPILKRNGFRGHYYNIAPHRLFKALLEGKQYAETLLKERQISLLKHVIYSNSDISHYWPSIRICFRNKYTVKNAKDWIDHVRMLSDEHRDILSPKYVCPADFRKEHKQIIKRMQRRIERQQLEARRKSDAAHDVIYQQTHGHLLDISITDNNITISPLTSVSEFYHEGKELHHCVYSSRYYDREQSLILSAKMNGKRIETIELSLSDFTILQARGLNNKPSKYHNKIVNLVMSNINIISQRHQQMIAV